MSAKSWRKLNKGWGIAGHPDLRIIGRVCVQKRHDKPHCFKWSEWTIKEIMDIVYEYRGIRIMSHNGFFASNPPFEMEQLIELICDRMHEEAIDDMYYTRQDPISLDWYPL